MLPFLSVLSKQSSSKELTFILRRLTRSKSMLLKLIPGLFGCGPSVSYTHLDVYKRQLFTSQLITFWSNIVLIHFLSSFIGNWMPRLGYVIGSVNIEVLFMAVYFYLSLFDWFSFHVCTLVIGYQQFIFSLLLYYLICC